MQNQKRNLVFVHVVENMSDSQPYKLKPIDLPSKPGGFRDWAVHNILKMHKEFFKFKPIEPLIDNPSLIPRFIVKSYQYHFLIQPKKPCIDCFLMNYFGADLFTDVECAAAALKLKEKLSSDPIF